MYEIFWLILVYSTNNKKVVFYSSHYSEQGYISNNSRRSTQCTGSDAATAGKRKKNGGIFCLVL
jgi:hypothetical protein